MSEATPLENQPNNEASQIALNVGSSLLKENNYSKLSEEDLINQNVIPNDQQFVGFIMEKLGLSSSLQPEVGKRLGSKIPPPQDTLHGQILEKQTLTLEEELAIKKSILLKQPNEILQDLERASRSERREFAHMILDRAGIWRMKEYSSFDPDKIINNLDLLTRILEYEPEAIKIKEDTNRYWALRIPQEKTGSLVGLMSAGFSPGIDEYVIVTDPNRNSELSTYFFSHPSLIRYYSAIELGEIEAGKLQDLDQEFRRASIDKYDRIKKEVESVNFPLRKHAFDLLLKDAQKNGEITLLEIFRDSYDTAALKGEAPVKTDRLGSESNVKTYSISVNGENLVVSDHSEDSPTYHVRFNNQENLLNFGIKNEKGDIVWNSDGNFHYKKTTNGYFAPNEGEFPPISWGEEIFNRIEALSISQKLAMREAGTKVAQKIIDQLLKTESSVEFFQKSSEYGISDYPRRQIIVDTNKRLHYVTDQFPINSPANSRNN